MATGSEKKELLKLIDEQQQQLQRYEKRLGDVVAAYKSLHKEKKALESSLKALSLVQTQSPSNQATQINPANPEIPNDSSEVACIADGGTLEGSSKCHEEQIATLTKALATLTNEKSRMEANFKADKKKLKQETDELIAKAKQGQQELERQKNSLSTEVSELRKKVWSQQMEREKEHSDHAVMLRELQTLVAIERRGKEQLELQLEDLQRSLDRRPDFQQKCAEYQNKIQELSDKLEDVKVRLKESEERADQPQPLLLKLQKELDSLKEQHQTSIIHERLRANEAEEQLQQMAQMSEERVANLELKLSELSETVGNYDRIRQQDQHAINILKERAAQLDRENLLLSGASGLNVRESTAKYENDDEDSNLDIHSLMGRMLKLKKLLHAANQRSENPIDLKEILTYEGLTSEIDHRTCKEELNQLKEEFERYKLRAHSVLKNKCNKESNYSKEEEVLKLQVNELKNKLKILTAEMEEKDRNHSRLVEESNVLLSRTRQQHCEELFKCQTENRGKISELENEMQKHRSRTLVLLEEKENEIKRLKVSLGIASFDAQKMEVGSHNYAEGQDYDEIKESMSQLVLLGPSDGQLLHYVQEISRKDLEITSLRKAKHQIETAMRDLQTMMVAKEEKAIDEIEILKNKIYRLERNVSREGANLEYLKNVVLNYMLSSDNGSRHHMLNAIATLLKFSPKELLSVQQYNKAWWWQHTAKPNETL